MRSKVCRGLMGFWMLASCSAKAPRPRGPMSKQRDVRDEGAPTFGNTRPRELARELADQVIDQGLQLAR
jgi:hypothetical protein